MNIKHIVTVSALALAASCFAFGHGPMHHHGGGFWGRGGSHFWPGFVGGLMGGAIIETVRPMPPPPPVIYSTPIVTTPYYVQQPVVVPTIVPPHPIVEVPVCPRIEARPAKHKDEHPRMERAPMKKRNDVHGSKHTDQNTDKKAPMPHDAR